MDGSKTDRVTVFIGCGYMLTIYLLGHVVEKLDLCFLCYLR